jgi:DnaJ-class molecular chaperone
MTEDEKEDIEMYARVKLAHKVMGWDARVQRAKELEQQGIACVMCGGTGGNPHPIKFWDDCRVCNGTGQATS